MRDGKVREPLEREPLNSLTAERAETDRPKSCAASYGGEQRTGYHVDAAHLRVARYDGVVVRNGKMAAFEGTADIVVR